MFLILQRWRRKGVEARKVEIHHLPTLKYKCSLPNAIYCSMTLVLLEKKPSKTENSKDKKWADCVVSFLDWIQGDKFLLAPFIGIVWVCIDLLFLKRKKTPPPIQGYKRTHSCHSTLSVAFQATKFKVLLSYWPKHWRCSLCFVTSAASVYRDLICSETSNTLRNGLSLLSCMK